MCISSALLPHKTSMPFLANTQVAPCLEPVRAFARQDMQVSAFCLMDTLPSQQGAFPIRPFSADGSALIERAYSVSRQLAGLDPLPLVRLPALAQSSRSLEQTSRPPVRRTPAKRRRTFLTDLSPNPGSHFTKDENAGCEQHRSRVLSNPHLVELPTWLRPISVAVSALCWDHLRRIIHKDQSRFLPLFELWPLTRRAFLNPPKGLCQESQLNQGDSILESVKQPSEQKK